MTERELWLAVIKQAVDDALGVPVWDAEDAAEAWEWLSSDDPGENGFVWACRVVGLEPATIRMQLNKSCLSA